MAREKRIVKIGSVVRDGGDILPFATEWHTLSASSTNISQEKNVVDDSMFESFFNSNQTTVKSWTTSVSGFTNRGKAGYHASIKRLGSAIDAVDEPLSSEDGKVWYADRDRSLWQHGSVSVFADGVDVTEDVEIDHLQGRVVSETPLTNVTASFTFYTLLKICDVNSISLSLSLGVQDVSTFCDVQELNGWSLFSPEMKGVEVVLGGFEYNSTPWVWQGFKNNEEVVLDININGDGDGANARGCFIVQSKNLSGDLGERDVKRATYTLSNKNNVEHPFSWYLPSSSNMPKAVVKVLDAWQQREVVGVAYKGLSSTIWHGGYAFPESVDIDVDVNGISQISMSFQGTGIKDKQDEEKPESLILNFVSQSYEIRKSPLITGAMI